MPRTSRAKTPKTPPPPSVIGPQVADRIRSAGPWVGEVPEVWSGATVYGGKYQGDHNSAIGQTQWFGWGSSMGIVDQIPREDAVAKAVELAWKLPVSSLSWSVTPADDTAEALLVAATVRAGIERIVGGLRGVVRQVAGYPTRGFALIAPHLVHDPRMRVQVEGEDKRVGGYGLSRVAEIGPSVVDRWLPRPGGEWAVSTVYPTGDLASDVERCQVTLEPEQIIRLAWMPEDGGPTGLGLFRPAYALWQQRRTYLRLELQGFERGAFGVPILHAGPTARPADAANAQAVVRDLRTGARAWAQLPEGWTIDFADFPFAAAEIREARIQSGRDMARAALVPHLYTGEGNGTESLIDGQLDFAALGWGEAADQIADALGSICRRLADANFGDTADAPRIAHSRLAVRGAGQLLVALQAAVTAGLVTPGPEVEAMVRDVLDLPEMPEETVEAWEAKLRRMEGTPVGEIAAPPKAPEPEAEAPRKGVELAEMPAHDAELRTRCIADAMTAGPGGRPVRAAERAIRLSETRGRTEAGRDVLAGIASRWRARVSADYAADLASAGSLAKMARVPVPGQADLVDSMRRELRGIYRSGQDSASAELDRQRSDPALRAAIADGSAKVEEHRGTPRVVVAHEHRGCCGVPRLLGLMVLAEDAPVRPAKKRKPKGDAADIDRVDPEAAIKGVAASTAATLAARMSAAAMAAVQNAGFGGQGLDAEEIRRVAGEAVRGLSSGVDARQAQQDANAIFGLGRQQEFRAEGVERYLYSNLLESNVCESCAAVDGTVFGAEDLDYYATPATWCEGGDLCNCLVAAVLG